MLFHGIKPSVYRQLLNATEAFSPMRQNYLKHVKFCRDVIVSLFLPPALSSLWKAAVGRSAFETPSKQFKRAFRTLG